MKLFSIPNLLTLANLLCGCLAIVFAFDGNLVWSAYLVGIACVFDFLDGFVARALKIHSPIGKDLDSLADMVTFGVVPGVVMFKLIQIAVLSNSLPDNMFGDGLGYGEIWNHSDLFTWPKWMLAMPFLAFLIPLFSALRLAKFNNDTRQSDSFIGVPTPANSILICSLPLILRYSMDHFSKEWTVYPPLSQLPPVSFLDILYSKASQLLDNPWILIGVSLVMSFLLISEIPLFALKFKKFGWKGNEIRYSFLLISVAMIVVLKFIALPLIIVLYILMSIVNNLMIKSPQRREGAE